MDRASSGVPPLERAVAGAAPPNLPPLDAAPGRRRRGPGPVEKIRYEEVQWRYAESSTESLERIQVAKKETSEEHLDRIRREVADRKKVRAQERTATVMEEPEAPDPVLL